VCGPPGVMGRTAGETALLQTIMTDNRRCPQCLLSSCVDCYEPGCPGVKGFVLVSALSPDRKMMETMGREIRELEELVLRAGNFFAGLECGSTGVKGDVMNAALRIAGGRKAVQALRIAQQGVAKMLRKKAEREDSTQKLGKA